MKPQSTKEIPINEIGVLGDTETNILVHDGKVVWGCLPYTDSEACFAQLLGGGGSFTFRPTGSFRPQKQTYLPGTAVIESLWVTKTGVVVIHDALVWSDSKSRQVLVRTAHCTEGEVDLKVECKPCFDFGRSPRAVRWNVSDGIAQAQHGGLTLKLAMSGGAKPGKNVLHLRKDESAFVALCWGDVVPKTTYVAELLVLATCIEWQSWSSRIPFSNWRQELVQSAVALKLLNHKNGSFLAAATTSLPEAPGEDRNWDYRFTWLRDASLSERGLIWVGFVDEPQAFVEWVQGLPPLDTGFRVLYGLRGEIDLVEVELPGLSYGGAVPVRVGNGAYLQIQNDLWGQVICLIHQLGMKPDTQLWDLVRRLVTDAAKAIGQPDKGYWEVRGLPRVFASSQLYVWLALRRGSELARSWGYESYADEWARLADDLHAEILKNAVVDGVFTAYYGAGGTLDASCLLFALEGFLPPDDPRIVATVHAIAKELDRDGLLLRYKPEEFGDGFSSEEMPFLFCSFLLVAAYAVIGEVGLAEELLNKLLSFANPFGLFAEEIDPKSGAYWGNYPQALTHIGLIWAVRELTKAKAKVA